MITKTDFIIAVLFIPPFSGHWLKLAETIKQIRMRNNFGAGLSRNAIYNI